MKEFCYSCTAPLSIPDFKGNSETYCKYCCDEAGALLPREQVQKNVSIWFKGWQEEGLAEDVLLERAGQFMNGLPAWSNK